MMKNKIPSCVWLTASSARGRPTDDSDVGGGGGAEAPPVGGRAGVAATVRTTHGLDNKTAVTDNLSSAAGGQLHSSWTNDARSTNG